MCELGPMRTGVEVRVSPEDRARLDEVVADRNTPQKHVWRAWIVLLSADGVGTMEIARRTGQSKPTVWRWQERFAASGVDGLLRDKTRPPGRKPLSAAMIQQVVTKTTTEKPPAATHWTGRAMAKAVGIAVSSVQQIWRAHGLKPHLLRRFKLSNDPAFAEKLVDIVGLYVNPPDKALVLAVDEKRSHGVIAIHSLRVRLQPLTLEATHVSYRSPASSADRYDRYPNGSWSDFRIDGTE